MQCNYIADNAQNNVNRIQSTIQTTWTIDEKECKMDETMISQWLQCMKQNNTMQLQRRQYSKQYETIQSTTWKCLKQYQTIETSIA